ncbi:glycosyltransferase family 4 protein [Pseudomonas sp. S60]|uniref:glycosyltransferase family 4 protein n=1 Tax=Pseudomonas sp. S60 TaxID=211124 RepID=UPI001913F001|nr:glycosyltransferase family 1 protein [Pseudomonas sp. S60]MBK5012060.1 glycosyltransferase family 4 protein [Pseudomonas sp. S60]
MRIVIDMQGAQTESRFRGIGRYTMAFAQSVVRNRGGHEVYLVLNGMLNESIEPIRTAFIGLLPQSHIRVWYAEGPVADSHSNNLARRQTAEHVRQACIDALEPDVIHVTSFVEGYIDDAVIGSAALHEHALVSATLYDLIPFVSPQQYLDGNPAYKSHYLAKVAAFRDFDLLLSISDFARQEALALLHLTEEKVVNVSTAADDVFYPVTLAHEERTALLKQFGLREPFVLYTGGADERKNLPRLIEAFAAVKPNVGSTQLVFAGKMPEYYVNLYRQHGLDHGLADDDLAFTGYVSDAELRSLYSLCELYVFPSWHEGFGLPPLEAMKCGAPVIGANASSVPEVIGWDAATFDPHDPASIASKLEQALLDDAFRKALTAHGAERAEHFSWDRTGQAAIEAFEHAVAEREVSKLPVEQERDHLQRLIETLSTSAPLLKGEVCVERLAKAVDYSVQQPSSVPNLFVDISELCKHDGKSGIQRVVRSILLEWLVNPPSTYKVVPVYTKAGEPFYREASLFTAKFLGQEPGEVLQDEVISYRAGDVYLGLDLLMDVLPHKKIYFNAMRDHGVSILFVVYDLLILQLPHCFVESLHEHYEKWIHTVAEYDGAICISQAVADELHDWRLEHMPPRQRPFHIGAFHLGADLDQSVPSLGFPEDPAMRLEALEDNPTFLMVGTLEPRKGHAQTLDAFEQLWADGVQANLVIVGKHGWLVDELAQRLTHHAERGKRLLWLSGASDEYLEHLYQASDCLVAGSYGEGFGLPLIEAAQHKLPIIARDLPVFREVAGDNAWYFEGTHTEEIAQKIKQWLGLFEKGEHPQSTDMPWLTWKASAKQLVDAIDKCAF